MTNLDTLTMQVGTGLQTDTLTVKVGIPVGIPTWTDLDILTMQLWSRVLEVIVDITEIENFIQNQKYNFCCLQIFFCKFL